MVKWTSLHRHCDRRESGKRLASEYESFAYLRVSLALRPSVLAPDPESTADDGAGGAAP